MEHQETHNQTPKHAGQDQPTTARQLFAPAQPITNTRDRITAAALNLFYTLGFHAVGIDRVIKDVGVTKTTFYNHFESKDELVVAAIEMRDKWEQTAFAKTLARHTDGSPKDTIIAFFRALDEWFSEPKYKGCIFMTACTDFPSPTDPVNAAARKHFTHTKKELANLARAAGLHNPNQLADQLEVLLQGALITRLTTGNDNAAKSAQEIAEQLIKAHETP